MKMIFEYLDDEKRVVDLVPGIASYPTRSLKNSQRFIKATLPNEYQEDEAFLSKIRNSAHHDYVDSEDLFSFIGGD